MHTSAQEAPGFRVQGAQAPQLVDDAAVGDFVAPLVGGDGAADLGQNRVTVFNRVSGGGAMTHFGGPLLRQARAGI